ncbi:hypothetical protein OHA98_20645 [Streptomyces sp. NBC_00654]|uniref:hypothetical protein n=1 Tax=Streptomyces sp. NBC_00654 TaxID=2975799 RepID=UPI002254D7EE|nr:hypothetical protein [Streptomyces sp. NBC_00654]MCX4967151.1 hypothetical protein [Streptomyces sp. NBC_00654]
MDGYSAKSAGVNPRWGYFLDGTPQWVRKCPSHQRLSEQAWMVPVVSLGQPFGVVKLFTIVGKLVGVAPLVSSGELVEGPVTQEHSESATITVTDTTTEGIAAGLKADASVDYGQTVCPGQRDSGVDGSLVRSKQTTHSATAERDYTDKVR